MKNSSKKGFTVNEILIILAVIGLITVLSVFSLKIVSSRHRDAKRIADISNVRRALEIYYSKQKHYPSNFGPGQALILPNQSNRIITFPHNIYTNNQPCGPVNDYIYTSDGAGSSYHISYCLETKSFHNKSNACQATPKDICE